MAATDLAQFTARPLLMEQRAMRKLMARIESGYIEQSPDVPDGPVPTGSTRVIQIVGPLVNRSSWMDKLFGFSSYQAIGDDLAEAVADPSVERIVLDIDSGGGEVSGAFELAEQIRAATETKPVVAVANTMAASAAYLLASAADSVYMTRSGMVGSIGVVVAHIDQSEAERSAGIKVTLISSGARKVDGNPHEPLGDDAAEAIMAEVNAFHAMFRDAVAEYRGISPTAIDAQESRTFVGADAESSGLIDGIRSLDAVVDGASRSPNMNGASMDSSITAPSDELDAAVSVDVEAIRAEAITAERSRILALDTAAIGRPELADLLVEAKATGSTVEQFKAAAFEIRHDPAAAHLIASAEATELGVPAAHVVEVETLSEDSEPETPEQAEAAYDKRKDLQAEFPTREIYLAWFKNQHLIRTLGGPR